MKTSKEFREIKRYMNYMTGRYQRKIPLLRLYVFQRFDDPFMIIRVNASTENNAWKILRKNAKLVDESFKYNRKIRPSKKIFKLIKVIKFRQ